MIDLYVAATPNGLKVKIFLEEAGLAYRAIPLSLSNGDQFAPEFLAIAPNSKIPAIVDHNPAVGGGPLPLFESGALLLYLAEKSGQFVPANPRERQEVIQWLFWQMAGLGPMAGQMGYCSVYAPRKVPFAIERYHKETARLYTVLDRRLREREFIAGSYSIADMACYPWIVPHTAHGQDLGDFPNVQRWFNTLGERPAVKRSYAGTEDVYASVGKPVATAN